MGEAPRRRLLSNASHSPPVDSALRSCASCCRREPLAASAHAPPPALASAFSESPDSPDGVSAQPRAEGDDVDFDGQAAGLLRVELVRNPIMSLWPASIDWFVAVGEEYERAPG